MDEGTNPKFVARYPLLWRLLAVIGLVGAPLLLFVGAIRL